ncbi:MAG: hypothetical protein JJ863_34600 [Deltaproteobacteria bacterium]|nr:hypothetical protein [Deltaproteobacteria bacterium]
MKRAIAIAALLVASCSDPEVSQIMLRIEADPGVAAMTRSIQIQIDGGATRSAFVAAETVTLDGGDFPRTIAIAPKGDDPSRFYRVVVFARRESIDDPVAETFAQAALVGTYVRGETRTVVIRLEDSCIDVPCGTTQHCTGASCVEPPLVEPEPLDGGMGDMGMPPSDMGPGRCATDADCDDGIDCTIDACTTGNCTFEPVNAMCPTPSNVCVRAVCDLVAGCMDEPRSGPCDNGDFCDGADTCIDGTCTGGDSPCVGMSTCDESMDRCTGCVGSADCTNGETCTGGTCTCPGAVEDCSSPGDEDCDGQADCADFDCANTSCGSNGRVCTGGICGCRESTELCTVPGDEDCDGFANCADSDCQGRTCAPGYVCSGDLCVMDTFEICDDGIDNDSDGAVDCADSPECETAPCVSEMGPGFCAVGVCEPSCASSPENTMAACSDGVDNDCDGAEDCADSECSGVCPCSDLCSDGGSCTFTGPENTEARCSDGVDNDCDGAADCSDSQCTSTCYCRGSCGDMSITEPDMSMTVGLDF